MVERVDFGDVEQRIALIDHGQRRVADDHAIDRADEFDPVLAEQAADHGQQIALPHDIARFAYPARHAAARCAYPGGAIGAHRDCDILQPVARRDHADMGEHAQHARGADTDRIAIEA